MFSNFVTLTMFCAHFYRYFGTLKSQEIYDLYLKYKMDHDLFDYSPEEYLKLAKDYNSSA